RDQKDVTITVRDSGAGIPADFLPYVFDRFRQADSSSTRHQGGLGLGLAIAHHVVERHGGTIEAQSPGPGRGSTFTVRFPLAADQSVSTPAARHVPEHGDMALDISILLVDDDPDTCEGLTLVLSELGARVRVARSVREALSIDASDPAQVIISD